MGLVPSIISGVSGMSYEKPPETIESLTLTKAPLVELPDNELEAVAAGKGGRFLLKTIL